MQSSLQYMNPNDIHTQHYEHLSSEHREAASSTSIPFSYHETLKTEGNTSNYEYTMGSGSNNFGHFTTALYAPRIVPSNIDKQADGTSKEVHATRGYFSQETSFDNLNEASKKYFQQYKSTDGVDIHITVQENYHPINSMEAAAIQHTFPTKYQKREEEELRLAAEQIQVQHKHKLQSSHQILHQPMVQTEHRVSHQQTLQGRNSQNTASRPGSQHRPSSQHRVISVNQSVVGSVKSSQVKEGQPIKGQSRIQYVPFETKIIDYETREWVERVPVQRKVIEYQQKRTIEEVPKQVTKVEYVAVETRKEYVPHVYNETVVEMVPVERVVHKTSYIPVQTQIIHKPDGTKIQGQSRVLYRSPVQGVKPQSPLVLRNQVQRSVSTQKQGNRISQAVYQSPIAVPIHTSSIQYENIIRTEPTMSFPHIFAQTMSASYEVHQQPPMISRNSINRLISTQQIPSVQYVPYGAIDSIQRRQSFKTQEEIYRMQHPSQYVYSRIVPSSHIVYEQPQVILSPQVVLQQSVVSPIEYVPVRSSRYQTAAENYINKLQKQSKV